MVLSGNRWSSVAGRGHQRLAEANCAGRMHTNNPIAHRCARGSLTKPRLIVGGRPDTWRRGTGSAWLHAPRDWLHAPRDWLHAPRDWLHARPQRGGEPRRKLDEPRRKLDEPRRKLDEPRRASTDGRRVGRGSHGHARLVEDAVLGGASWAVGRPLRRRPRRRRHSRCPGRRAAHDGCSR